MEDSFIYISPQIEKLVVLSAVVECPFFRSWSEFPILVSTDVWVYLVFLSFTLVYSVSQ